MRDTVADHAPDSLAAPFLKSRQGQHLAAWLGAWHRRSALHCLRDQPPCSPAVSARFSYCLCRNTEVPAEVPLKPPICRRRHPAEVNNFSVAVLHVIGNAIRENMVHTDVRHSKAMALEQLACSALRVRISNGASSLGFGISRNEVG